MIDLGYQCNEKRPVMEVRAAQVKLS